MSLAVAKLTMLRTLLSFLCSLQIHRKPLLLIATKVRRVEKELELVS